MSYISLIFEILKAALDVLSDHDTIERILDNKTEEVTDNYVVLHQTENRTSNNKQDDQRKSQSIPQDQSEVSSTATEDQSYHSSKYSVDHSVTLSAISGS